MYCLVEPRPECTEDPECPDSQACINQRCIDPCIVQNPCARDAICTTHVHHPVCTCAEGYGGDPYTQCYRRTFLSFFIVFFCVDIVNINRFISISNVVTLNLRNTA